MSFYVKISIIVGAIVLLALLAIFLFSGGEEAKIKEVLREAVEAARGGRPEGVIRLISPEFEADGRTYEDVCAIVRGNVGPGKYRDVEIDDLEISTFGDTARAKFTLSIIQPANMPVPFIPYHIELDLKKQNEQWLITSARTRQPER